MNPFIRVSGLTYSYPGSLVPAIRNVSLSCSSGTCMAILGPAGSGKTTLAMALVGALHGITGGRLLGSIAISGEAVDQETIRGRTGIVFQNPEAAFCNLRVYEEVAFGLENLSVPTADMPAMISRALKATGLEGFENREVYHLSGGETQRLAIACAIAPDPPLLVLDEPFESVDPAGRRLLLKLLENLRCEGKTIVLTSKSWSVAHACADHAVFLSDGETVTQGRPLDLLEHHGQALLQAGVHVPFVSEVALSLRSHGYGISNIPVIVDEALFQFRSLGVTIVDDGRFSSGDCPAPFVPDALRVDRVSYSYSEQVRALKDVSMPLPSGSVIAWLGQNGSGKSTLAKVVAGLLRPSGGRIVAVSSGIGSRPKRSVRSGVAYVFQNPLQQFLTDTVFDEIAIGPRLAAPESRHRPDEVSNRVASEFGLDLVRGKHPLTIGVAMQRTLAIASAVALGPRVLIVDEPTSGQDGHASSLLRRMFRRLAEDGVTVVIITHDLEFAESCADVVHVLHDGNLVFSGPAWAFIPEDRLASKTSFERTQRIELLQRLGATANAGSPRTAQELAARLDRA